MKSILKNRKRQIVLMILFCFLLSANSFAYSYEDNPFGNNSFSDSPFDGDSSSGSGGGINPGDPNDDGIGILGDADHDDPIGDANWLIIVFGLTYGIYLYGKKRKENRT
jgi:hypothetical protein